jgi:hypothetical protein
MSMQRLPPEITERRDERPERPRRRPLPPGLGRWEFMVQTDNGKLRLEPTRRGVNLFWKRAPDTSLRASWHMHCLLNLYRGLRAVQRGQEVFEKYDVIESDDDPNDYFVCSLPPADYHITPRSDAEGQVLWWYDSACDDQSILKPRLPPELRHLRLRPVSKPVKKVIPRATLKQSLPIRVPIPRARLRSR